MGLPPQSPHYGLGLMKVRGGGTAELQLGIVRTLGAHVAELELGGPVFRSRSRVEKSPGHGAHVVEELQGGGCVSAM